MNARGNSVLIFVTVIMVVSILIVLGSFLLKSKLSEKNINQGSESSQSSIFTQQKEDLKTYINQEFKYSYKYPSFLKLRIDDIYFKGAGSSLSRGYYQDPDYFSIGVEPVPIIPPNRTDYYRDTNSAIALDYYKNNEKFKKIMVGEKAQIGRFGENDQAELPNSIFERLPDILVNGEMVQVFERNVTSNHITLLLKVDVFL